MKKKLTTLTLMVKPPVKKVPKIPYGEWDFKWATVDEIQDLKNQGYINNRYFYKEIMKYEIDFH
jgi:hypothetical protein